MMSSGLRGAVLVAFCWYVIIAAGQGGLPRAGPHEDAERDEDAMDSQMRSKPYAGVQLEDDSVSAILVAARQLFHSPGYTSIRVADIAHRAGVSRATVYNHFADKRSILYRVVRDYMTGYEQIGRRLKARVDPRDSTYKLLRNMIRDAMLWRIENADLRSAIETAKQMPGSGWQEANQAADRAMHSWISEIHQASASLHITRPDIDISFASIALYSMIEAALSTLSTSAPRAYVERIAEQLALMQWYAIYTIAPEDAPIAQDILPLKVSVPSA
jgi:AcrR family transcriptional regulator